MQDPYKVRLDIFEGPLDLLLYLVRKEEVEIAHIPIERITKQYLEYIETFKMLNIDLASEFIVMAANLMYIKSRSLLPRVEQPPEDEAEEDDPRWELIRQLIEYKKFKDAAQFLDQRAQHQATLFPVHPETVEPPPAPPTLPEVNVFDLIRAFQKVLDKLKPGELREIVDEQYTVSDRIEHLLKVVPVAKPVAFSSLFAGATSRDEIIVTFIAVLELMKLRYFRVTQDRPFGEIIIHRNERTEEEPPTAPGEGPAEAGETAASGPEDTSAEPPPADAPTSALEPAAAPPGASETPAEAAASPLSTS